MHRCRPREKVLIVELELNKLKTMLKQYQDFISEKKLFLALLGFPGKLLLCNNRSTIHRIHRMCTNVDPLKSADNGARIK